MRDGGSVRNLIEKKRVAKHPKPVSHVKIASDVEMFWQSKSKASSGAQASSNKQS